MARVIICASPIYGHVAPMQTIAANLVRRGHQVTVLTGTAFRESVEQTGAVFAPLTGRADYDLTILDSPERDALEPGPAQFEWDLREVFIGSLADQHRALRRLLADADADRESVIVLSEVMFLGTTPLMLGAPGPRPKAVVGIGVIPFALTSTDTAPFGMGLPPDSSEEGRARNREANTFMQEQILGAAQRLYEDVLAELGVTGHIPYFIDTPVLRPERFLQLSVEELSYRRSDTPEHVRFVGALPSVRPAGTDLPEWWDEVLAAEKVVVVTQGTVANKDLSALIEPTLQALADLPVLVVAATGREGTVRDTPANARVAQFIPFDDLLPHADVLVTNGGFGAVQQSLRYGTPMVVAGQTEDKLESNARLAATGSAINLATDTPTLTAIRAAVQTVLATGDYRLSAERLSKQYAGLDPLAAIAQTVDELTAG